MKNFIKENYLNILIFALYAVLTFIIGLHHEAWADEAQAWLISRDSTFYDIIFNVIKYDGHLALWYILLRVLFLLHFPYEALFIIPWICSCIGIYVFLFKLKMPLIIKIMFPFTFFIFYQYCIVARNHSLVFPVLMLIALYYKDRLQRPYRYAFLLIILANISAYSFVIACSLFVFFCADIVKTKKLSLKNITPLIITAIVYGIIILLFHRPADTVLEANIFPPPSILNVLNTAAKGILPPPKLYNILLTVCVYIICCLTFCKTRSQMLFFIFVNFMEIFMITAVGWTRPWHCGYIMLTLIFICLILSEENNINKLHFKQNTVFYTLIFFVFSLQIYWSAKTAIYDMKNNYSASKEAAEFIKENNLENLKIFGLGFHSVAINPYFKHNIYANFEQSYFNFKKSAIETYKEKTKKYISEIYPDVIVGEKRGISKYLDEYKTIKKRNYNEYVFKGCSYSAGTRHENDFYIYLKKDISL